MSEKLKNISNEEIVQWQEELYELERNCSTGKFGTSFEQKQKIDSLLARVRAKKMKYEKS